MKRNSIQPIVICSSYTVPLVAGGGLNAFNLAKTLVQKGKKVKLFSYNWGGTLKYKEVKDGVQIVRAPFLPKHIEEKKIKFWVSFPILILCYLKSIIRSEVIIFFGTLSSVPLLMLFIALAKLLKKKVVFRSTMLGADDISSLLLSYPNFWTKYLFGKLDIYYAISPAFTSSFLYHYKQKEKIFETFQGVNTNLFYPIEQSEKEILKNRLSLPSDIPIIISVGYLYNRKGYKEIFDVLSTIDLPFYYLIIGEYQSRNNPTIVKEKRDQMSFLYSYGKALLKSKVCFLGRQENVNQYLQGSDVFLINSVQEGVPNVLLEAMACGLGIVSNRMEGVYNTLTIPQQNAEIFEDSDQMAKALQKVILDNHYRKHIGKEATTLVHSMYSLNNVADKLLKYFEE